MGARLFFPKRIPEPKTMWDMEMNVFGKESKSSYKRWMIPLVDDALGKSKMKSGKILDVACGPGLLSKELAARSANFSVFGVDNSKYAIKLAKKNCADFKNVSFSMGNVSRMPYEDGCFDLVICKDSLHHFPNPKSAMKEMLRVTKPDGYLYIQDLRRDIPQYLLKTAMPPDTNFKKLQYYSTRAAYTKGEIGNIVKKLGIKKSLIGTKKISFDLAKKYSKLEIDRQALTAALQSRYVVTIKKSTKMAIRSETNK